MEQEKGYYQVAKEDKGIDYNFYGTWQVNYAKMIVNVSEVLRRTGKANPVMLDVGCACGVSTRAFKETGIFKKVIGIDKDEYMVKLGRETHGFKEDELMVMDATEVINSSMRRETVDFIHCSSVMEHIISKEDIKKVIGGWNKVLTKSGIIMVILPCVTASQSDAKIQEMDSSHMIIETPEWWLDQFGKTFVPQGNFQERFIKDLHTPSGEAPPPKGSDEPLKNFHYYYGKEWTIILLARR